MKILSLFSGIGAFEKALDRMGINYQLANFCEFDKYAVKSYCAIHGEDESKNLGDITKVDETALPNDIDLITYGFPCQDISLAGKQKGLFNADGTQTRSGLFFEALRIIEATQPKIAIAENVKNLTSKKFALQFKIVLDSLKAAGYNNYWQVLNAKDYGIPQNRERVFIVSIRKDIDNGAFEFPKPFGLNLRLKDLLEDEVDEKFYLSDRIIETFNRHKERNLSMGNGFGWKPTDGDVIANTLLACSNVRPSGNFVKIPQATKKGFIECEVGGVADLSFPNSKTRRGRVQEGGTVSPTLTAESSGICRIEPDYRIRKLTPKECFRLMGFDDADHAKAETVNSNSQLYKQAGNSIVVNVLEHIFKSLFDAVPFIINESGDYIG